MEQATKTELGESELSSRQLAIVNFPRTDEHTNDAKPAQTEGGNL
jgi:hypothetical protein